MIIGVTVDTCSIAEQRGQDGGGLYYAEEDSDTWLTQV